VYLQGETDSAEVYNYDVIALAIKLVRRGARLIGTNEDLADRVGAELHPGTGAMILPVAAVCGTGKLIKNWSTTHAQKEYGY